MSNLKLYYLYRDSENSKKYGEIVLSNPQNLKPGAAEESLVNLLIGGDFFIPNRVGIPALDGTQPDDTADSDYHEIELVEAAEPSEIPTHDYTVILANFRKYRDENPDEFGW
jgi:hypothetical protein